MGEYTKWAGELKVQPMRCPVCGGTSSVWQYVNDKHERNPGKVVRVVMCDESEFDDDLGLPMRINSCPLNMPSDAFYCETAADAVKLWNKFGSVLVAQRTANAGL